MCPVSEAPATIGALSSPALCLCKDSMTGGAGAAELGPVSLKVHFISHCGIPIATRTVPKLDKQEGATLYSRDPTAAALDNQHDASCSNCSHSSCNVLSRQCGNTLPRLFASPA